MTYTEAIKILGWSIATAITGGFFLGGFIIWLPKNLK